MSLRAEKYVCQRAQWIFFLGLQNWSPCHAGNNLRESSVNGNYANTFSAGLLLETAKLHILI